MAAKSRINGLNGMHTAGIFSDMTVDGPEIGTLVVIVDRAKNLPNRKTIGKQDPYCAARLGKEAKKTETDRRGGQTPRWDQELRYTVHDSPDYYQLKVSVFNDDKKTDLIGEAWVDLKEVVVAGGGQNDLWHTLNCKGKYAGEIRMEITYYDSRPKQEKPEKKKGSDANGVEAGGRDSLRGPRQPKAAVKRRPLPSDPVTGAPAPAPSAIPDHVQTPPRGYHAPTAESEYSDSPDREFRDSQNGVPEYVRPTQRGYSNPPSAVPDHMQGPQDGYQSSPQPTPPRGYQNPGNQVPDNMQTPPRGYQNQSNEYVQPLRHEYSNQQLDQQTPSRPYQNTQAAIPDHVRNPSQNYHSPPAGHQDQLQTSSRGYQNPPVSIPDHVQTPTRGYQQTPPKAIPEHMTTPQRPYQSPSYIPNQSPLQMVEYSTPPSKFASSQGYDNDQAMTRYGQSSEFITATPPSQPMPNDRYEIYDPMDRNDRRDRNEYNQRSPFDSHGDQMDNFEPNGRYNQRQIAYDIPQPDEYDSPPSPGGPPPPPPAHRSRKGGSNTRPAPAMITYGSYGFPDGQQSNPYEAPQEEVHRHSIPSYSPGHTYQAYSPEREHTQYQKSPNEPQQNSPAPRHHSYDSGYTGGDYRSMQPTVEDEVPSPSIASYSQHQASCSHASQYDDSRYDNVPSPAPLNLSGRGSAASGHNSVSTAPTHHYSNSSIGYTSGTSQTSYRDRSQTDASTSSQLSYNQMPQQDQRPRRASENPMDSSGYGVPPIPATLVPGMDPAIAQEISDRMYNEKRSSGGNSTRVRYPPQNIPQHQPSRAHRLSYVEPAQPPYVPESSSYDERQSRYSMAMVPVQKPRAISPNPHSIHRKSVSPAPSTYRVKRKSVSPAPPPSEDRRRLSGVPFGPDSYNALNPTLVGSVSTPSLSAAYDTKKDEDEKIILHDGREIDPSDHIPEHNYAPLLESKGPKYASQLPDRNYRPPSSSNSQQLVTTGRRPLQHRSARPQSMALTAPGYMNQSDPPTGRHRLQKKSNRIAAQQAAQQSSPLAPVSPYQENSSGYTPRSLPRANTIDFTTNENYAPSYNSNSQHYRGHSSSGPPPIPAKVPMIGAPPSSSQSTGSGGGDAWALLEEMKNIDLGSGRARRRNR